MEGNKKSANDIIGSLFGFDDETLRKTATESVAESLKVCEEQIKLNSITKLLIEKNILTEKEYLDTYKSIKINIIKNTISSLQDQYNANKDNKNMPLIEVELKGIQYKIDELQNILNKLDTE